MEVIERRRKVRMRNNSTQQGKARGSTKLVKETEDRDKKGFKTPHTPIISFKERLFQQAVYNAAVPKLDHEQKYYQYLSWQGQQYQFQEFAEFMSLTRWQTMKCNVVFNQI